MRNIKNVSAKSTKATKAAKPAADAINVSAIVSESKADAAASEAKAKSVFAKHEIVTTYAGASKPFTSRKSRTAISAVYNSLAGHPLSDRDNAFLAGLKAKYNGEQFPRLNADAGNLRRAIERGYINYGTEPNTFVLTELALTSRLA